MSPFAFRSWVDEKTVSLEIVSSEKLTESELEDIARRKMIIDTPDGKYRIIEIPREEFGKTLVTGEKFRTYHAKVEPVEV